jgi:outer membrane protein insertion porin family
LRSFYRARGWLDVQVEEPKIEVDLERGLAKVHIQITEGEPHVIHKVEIDARVREALGAELPSAPEGKRCSASETQSYGFELRTRLRKKGHPNPRVEVEVLRREGGGPAVDLRVVGDPGPVAKVASVALAGNKKTIDGVVRGKLQLEPGERYDGTKIDDAVRRLYLTGLFKSVEIVETPVDGDPTRLALEIRVEELQSRAVELLAGYGSYEQLRGGVRLEEKNLFGTGRDAALDNKISMKGWSSGLTLTDPDFLSTSSALTVGAEYFVREEPSFTDEAVGGTIALSRTLVDKLTARVGYTYRDRIGATADTQLPEDQLVDYTEGRVFVELRNDRRDSFLFPKRGHAELLAFERIAPEFGADVDLDRLTLRVSTIVGISRSLRLVLRSEQGALWPHDGSANVPLQERFFNGGEDSVRSFREARLGPKDAGGEAIGGEYRNIFGAELRFPFKGTFEGATFFDAGNVGRHVKDFGFDELRFGVGAGLRWLLPIGPARVDVAWNPDREAGERGWVVHFSVGYPY